MTTITFDTLAYARRLRDAGISEPQAEAQAAALADVLKGGAADLATKQDIAESKTELKTDMRVFEERTEGRFKLLQWMLAFNLALTVAVLFLLLRH